MAKDARCPICGDQSAYPTDVDHDHRTEGSSVHRPATFACRHGCDSRDLAAWAAHVDQIRAEWKTLNSV